MYIYTPLCRYWIAPYRRVLVFIVPHVDIELEDNKQFISNIPRTLLPIFPSFSPMDMVGKAWLPSNAYYPRTPDYTLYSGVHVCRSEHSDSSFVYGFMSFDYGLGTMTATTSSNLLQHCSGLIVLTLLPRNFWSGLFHLRIRIFLYRPMVLTKVIEFSHLYTGKTTYVVGIH